MHPIFLVVLRLLASAPLFGAASDPDPAACAPKTCGNLTISYPFWLTNQQPDYCGYPSFQLTCAADGRAILQNSYNQYDYVLHIYYSNSSFLLTNSRLFVSSCQITRYNISFALTQFTPSPLNHRLVFYYNCSTPPSGDNYRLRCGGDKDFVQYIPYSAVEPVGDGCQVSTVPVRGFAGATAANYTELLADGVLLEWRVADCTACNASKGRCGYNSTANDFMCICSNRTELGSCSAVSPVQKEKPNVAKVIGIGAGAGAGGFIALCFLFFLFYKCWKKKQRSTSSDRLSLTCSSWSSSKRDPELCASPYTHIFSHEELEGATNGFSAANELGDGGFGTVYKGKLRDGRTVAVKRLYKNNYRRVEQFMNEVDILSRLRHQNLVSFYGCTSRRSPELLLVYEFVPNGTVADHLHGNRAGEQHLTWPVRMNIAIETADALVYLHANEPQIVHRDVKTNNILLDNGFHVKVADFGLSRLFPLDKTHVSTVPQGTPGYVDPVYHQCYQLTDKSDVYSFGVVLVELISSKPAVDINRSSNEINLSNMAINRIHNSELDQLIDPMLGYQSDRETRRMITLVAELAYRCLQSDREIRPSIKEVLEVLKGIENGEGYPEKAEGSPREDAHLLKNNSLPSPDNVMERWASQSTVSSTSG